MRLDEFLMEHRTEVIERCRAKVTARRVPRPTLHELERGIPLFLDQLIETLRLRLASNPDKERIAARHGGDLLKEGFTVGQVVHDYGDVCQSVTDLAIERQTQISNEEFRLLNRCLDDAIADAVTEFSRLRDLHVAGADNERLGILAHEMRNLLASATLTFDVLKTGGVGVNGPTGALLERSLTRLGSLIARSMAEVRLEAGNFHRERIEVFRLLEDAEITAAPAARARGLMLSVPPPAESGLAVEGDPQILSAIVVNLVQNAVKFTRPEGTVALTARATADRIEIDVADECGGLPPGSTESLFQPFEQRGSDRTGLGLGLKIARRGAEAHGGEIRVRDIPGTGCVFTVSLPRAP